MDIYFPSPLSEEVCSRLSLPLAGTAWWRGIVLGVVLCMGEVRQGCSGFDAAPSRDVLCSGTFP